MAAAMRLPGAPSLFFLFYLFLLLPGLALRGARRLREVREGRAAPPSREAIWSSTLASLLGLLLLSWLTGRSFGYEFFAVPPFQWKHALAALAALAICFVIRAISRAVRSPEERRQMAVYAWAPRTPKEWTLWTAVVLVASVAEEVAYRGVGLSVLWYSLDNVWLAVFLSATAFALAHATQGWKSAIVIFVVALVMHGLVAWTGTLLFAIVVHALYDLIAGIAIGRTASRESSPLPA